MAQVYAAAGVAAVLLLVVLGIAVWRLRRDVSRLSAELVAGSKARTERPLVEPAEASVEPARALVDDPPSAKNVVGESVTVITRLDDKEVEPADLTTSRVASVTLGRPLVKVAAFSYGLHRAFDEENRLRARLAFRSELRRQRKLRRRAVRSTPPGGASPGRAPAGGGGS